MTCRRVLTNELRWIILWVGNKFGGGEGAPSTFKVGWGWEGVGGGGVMHLLNPYNYLTLDLRKSIDALCNMV